MSMMSRLSKPRFRARSATRCRLSQAIAQLRIPDPPCSCSLPGGACEVLSRIRGDDFQILAVIEGQQGVARTDSRMRTARSRHDAGQCFIDSVCKSAQANMMWSSWVINRMPSSDFLLTLFLLRSAQDGAKGCQPTEGDCGFVRRNQSVPNIEVQRDHRFPIIDVHATGTALGASLQCQFGWSGARRNVRGVGIMPSGGVADVRKVR